MLPILGAVAKRTITFLVVGLVFAMFASSASAECGPGFSSKQQLIQYYKHNPSAAQGFRKELLAHSAYTGYHADETVLNYLRDPEQKVFAAPAGYVLDKNTYCPGGPGKYQPYHGLLTNMPGKAMLWHCPKGSNCVPLLKGYCMNFVMGPPIMKKSPPKKQPPKKCKCKKHHKKPKPKCSTKSPSGGGGNCVTQTVTVTPKQECEANNHSGTNCQQTTTTVVVNCGNYSADNPGNVNQGGNCNNGGTETCVGQGNCVVTPPPPPPCPCKEEPKPEIRITGKTELNMIPAGKTSGPFYVNVYASESGGTLMLDPGIGGISSCSSSTPEDTITTSVPSGASKQCVILYAPEDKDKPASMTVTMTACLGAVCDTMTETVPITYPTRPE